MARRNRVGETQHYVESEGTQSHVTEKNLTALALVYSLEPSPARSSSELIAKHLQEQLEPYGVTGEFSAAWISTSSPVSRRSWRPTS